MSNNKNLLLILNVVLLIAVAVLFILHFNSKPESVLKQAEEKISDYKEDSLKTDEQENEEDSISVVFPQEYKIVYVNTDKMWEEYQFVARNKKILERSEKQMRTQYEEKYKKLEKDYTNFMKLGQEGLLSQSQQQQKARQLELQKEEIDALDMKLSDQLLRQRENLNTQLNDSILAFLDRYRETNNYTFIFQYSYLNSLLSAEKSLDVTNDVVKGLNKEYDSFKNRL